MAISLKQSHTLMHTLGTNIDWSQVDEAVAQRGIDSPQASGAEFLHFVQNGCRVQIVLKQFVPFRTIKLGTGPKTADDFRAALRQAKSQIGDYANDIMGKPAFVVNPEPSERELVRVSVGELGFPKGAKLSEIYVRAQELGLELCPPEVGPQLRLQYLDQPNGEVLIVAMEPIVASGGHRRVFHVYRNGDGELWLSTDYDFPDFVWDADDQFVFLSRK